MAKNEAKASKKENEKNKRSFSKDFKAELKKVVWPTPKQLINNTAVVITIVLITAAIVFVLDLIFETTSKFAVNQVEKAITASQEETTDSENIGNEDTNSDNANSEDTNNESTNNDNASNENIDSENASNENASSEVTNSETEANSVTNEEQNNEAEAQESEANRAE